MKIYWLTAALTLFSLTSSAQECGQLDPAFVHDTEVAVSRLLSFPGYTSLDEKALNQAGDFAAQVVAKTVTTAEMDSPAKARQILLILHMAFEAPQIIANACGRTPTSALLLLDKLERTEYGRGTPTANARFEIEHNVGTGKPLERVSLPGEPVADEEHTQWVNSVLAWIHDIKPGMTRKDLLRGFTTEGVSSRTRHTYVLKSCPYIKIDVEFAFVSKEPDPGTEMPTDKIVKISKPYLEYSVFD